jgi:COP9 signalosome complex subunit 4
MDSGHRQVPEVFKCTMFIRITGLFLEEEDAASAETFLNRAGVLVGSCEGLGQELIFRYEGVELIGRYKSCQARVLDFKREFVLAAQKYYSLSNIMEIAEEERVQALSAAIICAGTIDTLIWLVLAPAGPARTQILATFHADTRLDAVPQSLSKILENMYFSRLIPPSSLQEFITLLRPHQMAKLGDGVRTVVDRAVMEHNLLSATGLYANIGVEELARLLGCKDGEEAERAARRMISEGRMKGRIDQIDGVVYFCEGGLTEGLDVGIVGVCEGIDSIVERIAEVRRGVSA